ncbi:hypothetical protein V8E54_006687 [Elaphomyces granulatus]
MNQPRERSKADSREDRVDQIEGELKSRNDRVDRIEGELKIQKTQIAKLNAFSEKAKCERADILNSENMGAPRTKE